MSSDEGPRSNASNRANSVKSTNSVPVLDWYIFYMENLVWLCGYCNQMTVGSVLKLSILDKDLPLLHKVEKIWFDGNYAKFCQPS